MDNILRTKIKIEELEHAMTVEWNGHLLTVDRREITKHDLFGYAFRGDCSKQEITRVQFLVPTAYGNELR